MTETTEVKPSEQWLAWLEEMKRAKQEDGESDTDHSNRCLSVGVAKGWNRQCSLGWHDECSMRPGQDGCDCPCHQYDKGMLHSALIEVEGELADMRARMALIKSVVEAYGFADIEIVAVVRAGLEHVRDEGRNLIPDATDDQATVIETWAAGLLAL